MIDINQEKPIEGQLNNTKTTSKKDSNSNGKRHL